jgi:hypothetical protein
MRKHTTVCTVSIWYKLLCDIQDLALNMFEENLSVSVVWMHWISISVLHNVNFCTPSSPQVYIVINLLQCILTFTAHGVKFALRIFTVFQCFMEIATLNTRSVYCVFVGNRCYLCITIAQKYLMLRFLSVVMLLLFPSCFSLVMFLHC